MTHPTPELLALRDAFPLAFPVDEAALRPLAIDTRDRLLEWAASRPDLNPKRLRDALCQHCQRTRYRRTLVAGAMRINLQGEPVAPVTEEAAALALERMAQDREAKAQAAIQREERRARLMAQQAKLQAEAAARRAAKAAKPPKEKKAKPKAAPTPKPAAPVAPAPKPAAAVVVVKKRRVIPQG